MAQFIVVGTTAINVENIHGVTVSRNPNPPATGDTNLITVVFNDGQPEVEFVEHDVAAFRQQWSHFGFPNLPSA